jgi:hypothetical protein
MPRPPRPQPPPPRRCGNQYKDETTGRMVTCNAMLYITSGTCPNCDRR